MLQKRNRPPGRDIDFPSASARRGCCKGSTCSPRGRRITFKGKSSALRPPVHHDPTAFDPLMSDAPSPRPDRRRRSADRLGIVLRLRRSRSPSPTSARIPGGSHPGNRPSASRKGGEDESRIESHDQSSPFALQRPYAPAARPLTGFIPIESTKGTKIILIEEPNRIDATWPKPRRQTRHKPSQN